MSDDKRKQAPKMPSEQFVRLWMQGGINAVCEAGMERNSAHQRAAKLRKLGVKLPISKRAPTLDVAALNAIIDGAGK